MRAQSKHRFRALSSLSMVFVLSFWPVLPARAVFSHHEGLRKEIEALEMQWRQALLTDDLGAIDKLLADDYLGISANGTLETKADVLAEQRSGQFKISLIDLSDIKIRIYGDTAVVTSKADIVGRNGDHDISGHYRYTRVYTNRQGQWRIVSFEASRIPDSSERAAKH